MISLLTTISFSFLLFYGPLSNADDLNLHKTVKLVGKTFNELNKGDLQKGCHDLAGESTKSQNCEKVYQPLKDKPIIEVRIVLGYDDNMGETFDIVNKSTLVEKFIKPCRINHFSCGFKRDPDDADLLIKSLKNPTGETQEVRLIIINSSISSNDNNNRGSQRLKQDQKSMLAKKIFLDGLVNSDLVIYNGHSRHGGGPSFEPPRKQKNGRTDESWYRKTRPGVNDMISTLQAAGSKQAPFIAILSCESLGHFGADLKRVAPNSNLGSVLN
jgi:hypothetical protein